ncbi:S26 family signal peptidase [Umezawaea sp. NPDC059074]|uniref:S26 family signal peptidase n=1 Tax=Umezawaea sp. NPDC059074 TaxID=3346716 RepID=UPI00367F8797
MLAASGVVVRWVRTRLLVVHVTGPSMAPTFRDGQRVLARRTSGAPANGAVVVASPFPDSRLVVKRVAAVAGDVVPAEVVRAAGCPVGSLVPRGSLVLLGDNPRESIDSRVWGFVPVSSVLATVVRKMRTEFAPEPEWQLMDEPVPLSEVYSENQSGPFLFRLRVDEGEP